MRTNKPTGKGMRRHSGTIFRAAPTGPGGPNAGPISVGPVTLEELNQRVTDLEKVINQITLAFHINSNFDVTIPGNVTILKNAAVRGDVNLV